MMRQHSDNAQDNDTAQDNDNAQEAAPVRVRRPVRVRTVVFGLVMLAISALSLITLLTDVHVNATAVGLTLMIGAGAALVAGGVAAAVREARGGPGSR